MKKIYKTLLLLVFPSLVFPQTIVKDDMQQIFDQMFSNTNTSYIGSGYLYERTYHNSRMDMLNGIKDTIVGGRAWRDIYDELYRMSVNSPSLSHIDVLSKKIENNFRLGINPLMVFYFEYNQIKTNAFSTNLLDTINKKIVDVLPRSQNPYDTKLLVAASPASVSLGYGPVTFFIDLKSYITNKPGAITKVEIDFGDGNGYQLANLADYSKTINYPDTIKHIILVRLTNQSNQQFIAKTYYKSLGPTGPFGNVASLSTTFYAKTELSNPVHDQGFWITATQAYLGQALRAYCTVSYGKDNGTRRNKIKKPIIFVEGFDSGYQGHSGFNSLQKCGQLGYIDLKRGVKSKYNDDDQATDEDIDVFPQFQKGSELIQRVNDAGYDLIYVDFENPTDYMQNNAFVVMELIKYLNELKNLNGVCGDNVIIGASLGGQVARYTLSYMEKNKINHSCRLFGMFDSPNDGANIPLGFQYFVNYFADHMIGDAKDKLKYGRDAGLNCVAAKQLLKYHHLDNGGTDILRTNFMNELNQMGSFPGLPKIAAINGSATATKQDFNDGDRLLKLKLPVSTASGATAGAIAGSFIPGVGTAIGAVAGAVIGKYIIHDYEGDVYALNTSSDIIFRGTSPFHSITTKYPPASFLKYDNAPGGQSNGIQTQTFPKKGVLKGLVLDAFDAPFAFIPANSSMAIKSPYNDDLELNIGTIIDRDNPNPNYTIYDAYFAPNQGNNEYHVLITPEGIEFLIEKLQESDDILSSALPNSTHNNTLHSTYNIVSHKYRKKLYDISVKNNGKLYFNGNFNGEYGDVPPPQVGSTLNIETSDCGPFVEVQNGGEFILGASSPNNKAILKIKTGSIFELRSGAKLIVNDNSKLIIEAGAKFIVEPGAEIQLLGSNAIVEVQDGSFFNVMIGNGTLKITKGQSSQGGIFQLTNGILSIERTGHLINEECKILIGNKAKLIYFQDAEIQLLGDNAVLEIQGDLELAAGSNFTFTYPNNSSGYVKFSKPGFNTRNIKMPNSGTASITFNGANQNDKILEITQEALYGPDGATGLSITNGLVQLGGIGSIVAGCPLSINHVKITSTSGGPSRHRGVVVFGQSNDIRNSAIEYGATGITGILNNNTLNVTNCIVRHCNTGIKTTGGSVKLGATNLSNNAEHGWYADGLTGTSTATGIFSNNGACGIAVVNTGVAFLTVTGTLNNNGLYGIYSRGGRLNVRCSGIQNNGTYGIYAAQGCVLNMSSIFKAGYSNLSNNPLPVFFEDATNLLLNAGYNTFSTGTCVSKNRVLNCPQVFDGNLIRSCLIPINASNNKWNNSLQPPEYFLTGLGNCAGSIPIIPFNLNAFTFNSCGQFDGAVNPNDPLYSCAGCPVLNTPNFNGVSYNVAIQTALANMRLNDSTKSDLTAIAMFKEILTAAIANPSANVQSLSNLAFSNMNIALSNAFTTGEIPQGNNNTAIHPSTQAVLDVYDHLDVPATGSNYKQVFYNDLGKGQVLRISGQKDLAIQQFQSIGNCFIGQNELKQVNQWIALTKAENLVLNGTVPIEKFDSIYTSPAIPVKKPARISSRSSVNASALIGSGVVVGAGSSVAQNAVIGDNVVIGTNVSIQQNVNIGAGTTIGNNTTIDKDAVIGANSVIANNVTIDKSVVVGSNVQLASGVKLSKDIKLGNMVALGSNTQLDKNVQVSDGSEIGNSVSISQEVLVGSNVVVQSNTSIAKQVQVGNASVIGANVSIDKGTLIGSNVSIAPGINIGKDAKIYDGSIVTGNVAANTIVTNTNNTAGFSALAFAAPVMTPPSTPFQLTYDCAFVLQKAKISVNFFNGFTAANTDANKQNFCASQAIQFKPMDSYSSYSWDFGDCGTSTEEKPTHTYSKPGVYAVTLTQNVNGCAASTVVKIGSITVQPSPNADFDYQITPLCSQNNTVKFNKANVPGDLGPAACSNQSVQCNSYAALDSGDYRIKYDWNFGQFKAPLQEIFTFKQIARNADSNITCNYPAPNAYSVSLTATTQVKNKMTGQWVSTDCIKTFTNDSIVTGQAVDAGFAVASSGCTNDTVAFANTSAGGMAPVSYVWHFGNNTTSIEANPKVKYATDGLYDVTLIATDANGCSDTTVQQVFVPECPSLDINGIVLTHPMCGGTPVANDTLVLVDAGGNRVNGVSPAITANDGTFTFDGDELAALDQNARFGFAVKSGVNLADTTTKTLSEWASSSPLSLLLACATFQKVLGGTADESNGRCIKMSNGDFVIAGTTTSFGAGGQDILVMRFNSQFELLWSKTYGGSGNEFLFETQAIAHPIMPASDGGIILAGTTTSWGAGQGDIYVIRIDDNGNLIWSNAFGTAANERGINVQETPDGGFLVGGDISAGPFGGSDGYLIKTNSTGTLQWTKTIGGSNHESFYDMRSLPDGGAVLSGATLSFGASGFDAFIIRIDAGGNTLWSKKYEYGSNDGFYSILPLGNGGFIAGGNTDVQGWLVRMDENGNVLWNKTYSGNGAEIFFDIVQTHDDGFAAVAQVQGFGAGGWDYMLTRVGSAGNSIWSMSYGGPANELPRSVVLAGDGGFIISGATNSFGFGQNDIYVVKTDASGFSGCNEMVATPLSDNISVSVSNITPEFTSGVNTSSAFTQVNIAMVQEATPCQQYGKKESEPGQPSTNENSGEENNGGFAGSMERNKVTIYPNPNNGNMQVEYTIPEGETGQFSVFDLAGKMLLTYNLQEGHRVFTISNTELQNGIYFYQLVSDNKIIDKNKLVIIK